MEKKNDHQDASIRCLKGVGPKIAAILEGRGIRNVEDLLYFLPVRYEDRRDIRKISEISEGDYAVIVAEVLTSRTLYYRHARKRGFEITVHDETGSIKAKWFRSLPGYFASLRKTGSLLLLSGTVNQYGDGLQMVHPEITLLEDENAIENRSVIVPIYPVIEGLKQGRLRTVIKKALEDHAQSVESVLPGEIETLHNLVPIRDAFCALHDPTGVMMTKSGRDQYRERLIFEEYLLFQLALLAKKGERKGSRGIPFYAGGFLYEKLRKELPFQLTPAQEKVLREITDDMTRKEPMNRLLQGDVGCGKTICALLAVSVALDNGHQAAFLAPTEVLAEQHYLAIHKVFDSLGIPVILLRGGLGRGRKDILKRLAQDDVLVVVGTHALLQEDVVFRRLGLVVIDEQHKFGVIQRSLLKDKRPGARSRGSVNTATPERETQNAKLETGPSPHVLVMTATPIPRTLSMVIYGDLDVSVIDEIPPGREKVWTKVYFERQRPAAYRMIEEEVQRGHQVYVVYPLVEESDRLELANAKEMAGHLQREVFPHHKIGLLHGQMKTQEKEKVMLRLKDGNIDILVCTTVIEVGIDVPNATMIVIEHSERFGLSQLHQLRGRVGRSLYASKCILITSAMAGELAARRLRILEETTDGFEIAEEDMKMRGPGDIMGYRQSGVPRFRIGDILRDGDTMTRARRVAEEVIDRLPADKLQRVEEIARERWTASADLFDVA